MQKPFQQLAKMAGLLLLVLACTVSVAAQTTGDVGGTVTDPQGATVPGAEVTLTEKATGQSQTQQSTSEGQFKFTGLKPGVYNITIKATNFKALTLTDVRVSLGQTTDVPAQLTIGLAGETVEVSAAGTELVDTTTTTLTKSFNERQVVELAQTGISSTGGVNNLALIAPNVSSSGGVGVGTGGSVGGQRPRNNNFVLDGVDNNDKSVTGPQSYISPEEVAEFTLIQNQFSAEFGRSNGGQFLTVTKSGTNDYHGSFYGFFRNRYFNALDTLQKNAGVTRNRADGDNFMPRYDRFRGGVNFGGPIPIPNWTGEDRMFWSGKDKLFFFTSYERLQEGSAASAGGIQTPTAAGFAALAALPGVRATNLSVMQQNLPVASAQTATMSVCKVAVVHAQCPTAQLTTIPVGDVSFPSPNFFKQNHVVGNIDYNQSAATQYRFRFTMTNRSDIDTAANLPQFFNSVPQKQRLFSATMLHNFTSSLINEARVAFRRSSQNFNVPGFSFPGLSTFPNIGLNDLGVDIGPDPNAPQTNIENNYQLVDNMTWLTGNHSFKFGGDFRWIISPQTFSQRVRGDYQYNFTDNYLRDFSPEFGERNAGSSVYYGNQKVLYAFVQDDWKARPNLTLNMGVNWSYQQVPLGARTSQALNSISTVPGLLVFREPKTQLKNFGPRVGFAYAPDYTSGLLGSVFGSGGKSSIRAGFSMAYDYIFDNLYILSNPPQLQQTNDAPTPEGALANFLASGALPDNPVAITNPAVARANTGSYIPDQEVPYSLTWTLSWQRQFMKNWSFEARYLGTRGVHLLTQNRINRQAKVAPEEGRFGLPTFLTAPTQAQLNALTLTLAQIQARSNYVPRYANAGFNGASIVGFLSNGNSIYHGASAQVQKRFSAGLQMTAAYTWSHLIDDTTAEVFSTVLSPRRVEDFQNLRRERANSALDRRHRFVTAWIYEFPLFKNETGWAHTLVGGWQLAATYTAESGEFVTVRSGTDANQNGDNAGDRAIFNPAGTEGVGSLVTALTNTAGQTVAYLATNPNARYIQAGVGAQSNIGRNTFLMPGINNFDFSLFKNFHLGEGAKRFQLRADFYNALNHPQYIPGSPNDVTPISTTGVAQYNTVSPLTSDFLRADRVFSSNPRVIQFAARFDF